MKFYLFAMLVLFALAIIGNLYRLRDGDRPSSPNTIFCGAVIAFAMLAWTLYLIWSTR